MDRKKFLIIRFSSIGDIVLTTPVVRCLKEQYENAEVHYLTKSAFKDIIEPNPYIDKAYYLDDSLRDLNRPLTSEDYHFIIDLHNNLRSLIVKKSLPAKSFSVNKINIQKWLAVNFKRNVLPNSHIVDRYMYTISSLGVIYDGKGLDYFIPEKEEIDIRELPKIHKIISICSQINKPLVLLGDNEDRLTSEQVVDVVGDSVYNGCGLFSINRSASIIRQADKVITHDTSLMHVAAAFNKEIISIWGNTIPEFGMFPFYAEETNARSHIFEVNHLSCRPCSKIGFDKCPKGHFKCMEEISEEDILDTINQLT